MVDYCSEGMGVLFLKQLEQMARGFTQLTWGEMDIFTESVSMFTSQE